MAIALEGVGERMEGKCCSLEGLLLTLAVEVEDFLSLECHLPENDCVELNGLVRSRVSVRSLEVEILGRPQGFCRRMTDWVRLYELGRFYGAKVLASTEASNLVLIFDRAKLSF